MRQKKKLTTKKKKNRDEIEEKRWSEGWIMLMADGYGEESGLEREKEEEKKKKKKERKEMGRMRQDTINGGHHVNIFTEMPLKTELWKLKTVKMCFQFL